MDFYFQSEGQNTLLTWNSVNQVNAYTGVRINEMFLRQ